MIAIQCSSCNYTGLSRPGRSEFGRDWFGNFYCPRCYDAYRDFMEQKAREFLAQRNDSIQSISMNWIRVSDTDHKVLSDGDLYIIFSEDSGVGFAKFITFLKKWVDANDLQERRIIENVTHYMAMPQQPAGTKPRPTFAEGMEEVLEYMHKKNDDPSYHDPQQYLKWCCAEHESALHKK